MAKKNSSTALAKVAAGTLADLIGNSITFKNSDGSVLVIPADLSSNRVANMIVTAGLRQIIENAIKTYREKEMIPTPKDLKDLADAIKSLAQSSSEVYKMEEGAPINDKPKEAKPASTASPEVSFDDALEPPATPEKQ